MTRHFTQTAIRAQKELTIKLLKEQKKVTVRKRTSYILASKKARDSVINGDDLLGGAPQKKEKPGLSQFIKLAT